jgi:hypothetical protein
MVASSDSIALQIDLMVSMLILMLQVVEGDFTLFSVLVAKTCLGTSKRMKKNMRIEIKQQFIMMVSQYHVVTCRRRVISFCVFYT